MKRWLSLPSLAITLMVAGGIFAGAVQYESTQTALLWALGFLVVGLTLNVVITRARRPGAAGTRPTGSGGPTA